MKLEPRIFLKFSAILSLNILINFILIKKSMFFPYKKHILGNCQATKKCSVISAPLLSLIFLKNEHYVQFQSNSSSWLGFVNEDIIQEEEGVCTQAANTPVAIVYRQDDWLSYNERKYNVFTLKRCNRIWLNIFFIRRSS